MLCLCAGIFALDGCVPGCDDIWLGDGECDETCNVADCNYDNADCPAGQSATLTLLVSQIVHTSIAVLRLRCMLRHDVYAPQILVSATQRLMAATTVAS